MTTQVALRNGQSAEIRDVDDVTSGERKRIIKAVADDNGSEYDKSIAGAEQTVAVMVESWTLPLALPRDDITVLDQLSPKDYDTLVTAAADAAKALFEDFGPSPDPKAITPA